jgi:hypothetical protein
MTRTQFVIVLAAEIVLISTLPAMAQVDDAEAILEATLPEEGPSTPMPSGEPMTMPGEDGVRVVPLRQGKPRDYPAAGLQLTLPVGFIRQPLADPYQVVTAVRQEGMNTALSVTVSAYPVDKETQAGQLIQTVISELDGNIAIRRLRVEDPTALELAGRKAVGRRITYRTRGVWTVGMIACFIRDMPADGEDVPPAPVAYMFTFEALRKYEDSLDELIAEVGKGAQLIDFASPTAEKIDRTGPVVRDGKAGYAIRLPARWAVEFNEYGIAMSRVNYLLGDVRSPSVQVMASDVAADETSRHCGAETIAFEREQGWDIEILSQGPAKLAGRDAWQIVLRKKGRPDAEANGASSDEDKPQANPATKAGDAATQSPASIEVRRLMCMPAEPGAETKKHISIIMTCHDCSPQRVEEMMDAVAGGFSMLVADDEDEPTQGDFNMPDTEPTVPMPK